MAVPVNARIFRAAPLKTGVMLGVSPSSDPTFDVEFARATSSGVYETIDKVSPNTQGVYPKFTDILPGTTNTFSYKARATKDGWNPGDYTTPITVRPIALPEYFPPITPVTGKAIGVDVFLSTGQRLAYGNADNPSSFGKSVVISGTMFRPKSTGISYSYGIGTLVPTTRNPSTGQNYNATVFLPDNATVYKASWIYTRSSAASVFRAALYSVSTAGLATLQYGKTSTAVSSTPLVLTSSSFSFGVGANYLISEVAMKSTANGNDASIISLEVFYRTPNVQTAV